MLKKKSFRKCRHCGFKYGHSVLCSVALRCNHRFFTLHRDGKGKAVATAQCVDCRTLFTLVGMKEIAQFNERAKRMGYTQI